MPRFSNLSPGVILLSAVAGSISMTKVRSGSSQVPVCSMTCLTRSGPRPPAIPWYTMVESMKRSMMTIEPSCSAGSISSLIFCFLEARTRRSSVMVSSPSLRKRGLISSEIKEPPGSLSESHGSSFLLRYEQRCKACVDLPTPSPPSKLIITLYC